MKYGIDISSEKILSFISEGLRERGNFIIDLTDKKNSNTGRRILNKVVIANVTNVDFYFAINFNEDILFSEIFYSEYDCAKIFANKLKEIIHFKYKNISCKNGEYLYLVKNINAPVVYARFPIKNKIQIEDLLLKKDLINILEDIKI